MPTNVKHQFTSGKADDADTTLIRPSNWNDEHVGAIEIMDRDLDQVDVETTADEESLYSHSIPGNQIGATGGFRLTLSGDMLVNAAGTLELRVKLGATTVFTSSAIDPTETGDRYEWWLEILCMNSATDAQKWVVHFQCVSSTANWPLQLGGSDGAIVGAGVGSSAEDTTGALTLDVTADWSASSANLSFRKEMAVLEELPAA